MTLTFEQWQIEIRNNLTILSENALRLAENPTNLSKPDILRLYDYVKALDQMYENISEVTEN